LSPTRIADLPGRCSREMGGAAKIAVRRAIFKSITSAHAAGLEMMPKRI
jgi:hypothetical protein